MPNSLEITTPWSGSRPAWALRATGSVPLGKPSAAKRKGRTWDDRHHVTWNNESQHPNGRGYFDRYRDKDRSETGECPRPRVRPVWTLECPNVEEMNHTYKIFVANQATFKDVVWKVDEKGKPLGGEDGVPARTRTPRSSSDL